MNVKISLVNMVQHAKLSSYLYRNSTVNYLCVIKHRTCLMPSIVTVSMDTLENTVKLTLTTVKVIHVVNMAFA